MNAKGNNGFWNLSPEHTMYGHASELCAFRLMPLEAQFLKKIEAQWTWKVVDMERRLVAFQDLSVGQVTSWNWDFGDGQNSTVQHPLHSYTQPGNYVVILDIEGPDPRREGKADHLYSVKVTHTKNGDFKKREPRNGAGGRINIIRAEGVERGAWGETEKDGLGGNYSDWFQERHG